MMLRSRGRSGVIASALSAGILACGCTQAWSGQPLPDFPPLPNLAPFLSAGPSPARIKGKFSLAAAGDLIISTPMAHETLPGLGSTWTLLQRADIAFANMETPPVDARAVPTFPAGDALLRGPPQLAADAREMGFRLISLANNHATDLGPAAVLNTRQLFASAGVTVAGTGGTLEEARAPAYAETPKGRIALVATTSTFKPNSMAQDAIPDWPARAGVSVLHVYKVSIVTVQEMKSLKAIALRQSYGDYRPPASNATQLTLDGTIYRVGAKVGVTYEMSAYDLYAILKAVHDARQRASLVVFYIHAHQSATGADDGNPGPADFLITLSHEVIEAGADVVVVGGPHGNRGIAIFEGKPIFYGMGVFTLAGKGYFSQGAQMQYADMEAKGTWSEWLGPQVNQSAQAAVGAPIGHPRSWWESMVAVTDLEDGRVARIRIYPLDLGGKSADKQRRGRPLIAHGAAAARILGLIQRDSRQFGTKIERQGDLGLIDVTQTK